MPVDLGGNSVEYTGLKKRNRSELKLALQRDTIMVILKLIFVSVEDWKSRIDYFFDYYFDHFFIIDEQSVCVLLIVPIEFSIFATMYHLLLSRMKSNIKP